MGRKLILLADGTGNSARKLFKTNVWRFYQALDVSSASQSVYYSDGVGTSSFKPLALLGGIFGWGLKRNVLDLYTFLCRNYQPNQEDKIYGFGFSRGAFTIRVLVRFVLSQGLIKDFKSNHDLRRRARQAYRQFREQTTAHQRIPLVRIGRWLRDRVIAVLHHIFVSAPRGQQTVPAPKVDVNIEFLGLWDTVDAYGMPIEELKVGLSKFFFPLDLGDKKFDADRIRKACHVLAIDDQRTTFHPLLWDEVEEEERRSRKGLPERPDRIEDECLTQVWFAGVHASVGGGYPDDGLSNVSLEWMIGEAKKKGLKFDEIVVKDIAAHAAPYGKLYDSRAGLQAYYRYGPRPVAAPADKQEARILQPKVHESVLWRIVAGVDAYSPLELPKTLRVVSDVLTYPTDAQLAADPKHPRDFDQKTILGLDEYRAAVKARKSAYFLPEAELAPWDEARLNLIWDTVWWRRVATFITLALTLLLVAFPWVRSWFPGADVTPNAPTLKVLAGTVQLAAGTLKHILPGLAETWRDALEKSPCTYAGLMGLTLLTYLWGQFLAHRIHDRALAAWNKDWQKKRADWFEESLRFRVFTAMSLLFAAMTVFLTLGFYQDRIVEFACQLEADCTGEPALLVAAQIVLGILSVGIAATVRVILNMRASHTDEAHEYPGVALWLARQARTKLGCVHRCWTTCIVPWIGFALVVGLTLGALYLIVRFILETAVASPQVIDQLPT